MIRNHVLEWMANAPAMPNALVARRMIREKFLDENDRRLAWALRRIPRRQYLAVASAFHYAEGWDVNAPAPYGVSPSREAWVRLPNGLVMACGSGEVNVEGVDYVRFLNKRGGEVAYWAAEEWHEDPHEVMGAICGAMFGSDDTQASFYYQCHPDVRFPEGVEFEPYYGR